MSKSKPLTHLERDAMLARMRADRRAQIEEQAAAFVQTPAGAMMVALGEYVEGLGYVPTRWKFDEPLVPIAWSYYAREWSSQVASVAVVPASEPSACEVQVFRTTGRSLYAITTPSPAETLERLREFRVDGLPVVEWAKADGGDA